MKIYIFPQCTQSGRVLEDAQQLLGGHRYPVLPVDSCQVNG